ncbi:asparagine synthetase, nodule [glutamine-hydrolyzing]-like [Rhododendron vialii]|uniref:asparagine synthetase, nodule [glutamine-hydrolyzing]-like n=1 Tax=Rhododendron vialii TaxID=182163 RepID=UPI00265F34D7|nr:asparagine synthetase, nodule [glutamine-hydrolyzing]-like [Rhododendron vialii]
MIFERLFPQNPAMLTVPGGASIACSTAKAIEWDSSRSNNVDPSGRAALGVHLSAYEQKLPCVTNGNLGPKIIDNLSQMISVPGVATNTHVPRTIKKVN